MKRKSNDFFKWHKEHHYSLTYDDVSLKTGFSTVPPSGVSLKTKITKNVECKVPIASAAMDTVTEYELAIEMAKQGGIGFIHKNLTPKQQAHNVARVKNFLNGKTGLIKYPMTVKESETMGDLIAFRNKHNFAFKSFVVLNDKEQVVGVITDQHFLFFPEEDILIKDVMDTNHVTAKKDTKPDEAIEILKKKRRKNLILVDEDMKLVGQYSYKDLRAIKLGETEGYNMDEDGRLIVGAAISDGQFEENLERIRMLARKEVDVLLVDSAHGDTENMVNMIKYLNENYPDIDLLVGNISEPESAKRLLEAGTIHGLKVGQGPGSICSTRKIAGIGCPQLSAVHEIVEIADKYGVPVCADGGAKYSGDIVKAIGAGAHTVMLGSVLAGHDECPGEQVWIDGKLFKSYRGMGSEAAMNENAESRKRYRQDDENSKAGSNKKAAIPEGVESAVPFKGKLKGTIHMLQGGIRNGLGYVGAKDVEELREIGDFRRVTPAGAAESMPHSVHITKRPPNM